MGGGWRRKYKGCCEHAIGIQSCIISFKFFILTIL